MTFEKYIEREYEWIAKNKTDFSKDLSWLKSICKSLRRQKYFKKDWKTNYIIDSRDWSLKENHNYKIYEKFMSTSLKYKYISLKFLSLARKGN